MVFLPFFTVELSSWPKVGVSNSSDCRPKDCAHGKSSTNFTFKQVPSSWMQTLASFVEWMVRFFFPAVRETFLHHMRESTTVDNVHPVLRLYDRFGIVFGGREAFEELCFVHVTEKSFFMSPSPDSWCLAPIVLCDVPKWGAPLNGPACTS